MIKHEKETELSIEDAERKATEVLKKEGFGVLTRIDVSEKFKEKLGVDTEPYIILGACNPELAHRALQKNSDIGYLLPCNVLVYRKNGKTMIGTVLPKSLLSLVGKEAAEIAEEAEKKLKKAIDAIH